MGSGGVLTEHFHHERPHQGLENKIITRQFEALKPTESVGCRKRLGGLLQYYYPKEAKSACNGADSVSAHHG